MSQEFEYGDGPSKRRRISSGRDFSSGSRTPLSSIVLPKSNIARGYGNPATRFDGVSNEDQAEEEENITISATSKQATQTVAPFLAKHIPEQYAPMGGLDHSGGPTRSETNTKYCYRHRPDLKCRRQANEPSMDQLQHVSFRSFVLPTCPTNSSPGTRSALTERPASDSSCLVTLLCCALQASKSHTPRHPYAMLLSPTILYLLERPRSDQARFSERIATRNII